MVLLTIFRTGCSRLSGSRIKSNRNTHGTRRRGWLLRHHRTASCPPLVKQAGEKLKSGIRQARPFGENTSVETGHFFILDEQLACIHGKGASFQTSDGHSEAWRSCGTDRLLMWPVTQRRPVWSAGIVMMVCVPWTGRP